MKPHVPSKAEPHAGIEDQARSVDFTVRESGVVDFSDLTVLTRIPAGFYQPKEENGRRNYSIPKLETISSPVTTPERYFPIEEWHPDFKSVELQIRAFLKNMAHYSAQGIPFSRSILLVGESGIGKSTYLNNVCKRLIQSHEAVIIHIDDFSRLYILNKFVLDRLDLMDDQLKVLVIENVDQFNGDLDKVQIAGTLERIQKLPNVLVLMTSTLPATFRQDIIGSSSLINHIHRVSEKNYPPDFIEAWHTFVTGKPLKAKEKKTTWYQEAIQSISPAYLKELFLYSGIQKMSYEELWQELKKRKQLLKTHFGGASDLYEQFYDDLLLEEQLYLLELALSG